jgi:D-arabinose 1-dehydrogenase-like Zn-dependent alcohol dehydrogenase
MKQNTRIRKPETVKMKAAQISKSGGGFELVDRDIPEPGAGQVRVKVEACGICHSDVFVKDGVWPGLQYPRVPGHEIAGRIDALGSDSGNGRWVSALELAGMAGVALQLIVRLEKWLLERLSQG